MESAIFVPARNAVIYPYKVTQLMAKFQSISSQVRKFGSLTDASVGAPAPEMQARRLQQSPVNPQERKPALAMRNWTPTLSGRGGPKYLAIADTIAADIAAGRLAPGDRLPPQRDLAARLGLDFTTVARGYVEAGKRGLVESAVGTRHVRTPSRDGQRRRGGRADRAPISR